MSLIPKEGEDFTTREDSVLLTYKNNGGLFFPSKDLVTICQLTETEIRISKSLGLSTISERTIARKVIQNSSETFIQLRTMSNEEHPLFGDHVINLISLIAQQYLKVRVNYIAKEASLKLCPETRRNECNKTVLFSGN